MITEAGALESRSIPIFDLAIADASVWLLLLYIVLIETYDRLVITKEVYLTFALGVIF